MVTFDDIRDFLPKFLSDKELKKMFVEISAMLNNGVANNYFSTILKDEATIFQGDCLDKMPIFEFEGNNTPEIYKTKVMVLSNTCDISEENSRIVLPRVCYAPIYPLDTYIAILEEAGKSKTQISSHIESIKNQEYTSILFLPSHINGLGRDIIVYLDRIYNCSVSLINKADRLFSLSNFGFYILLLKISIHFTRIRDGVNRG